MFASDSMGEIIDGHTLRFVRVVKHSPERVWRAITNERELTEWMRYSVQFEARAGGRVQFFGDGAERIDGKVFVFDPPRTLAFSFFDGSNAEHREIEERDWAVRYDLEPAGDGCRITFTHRNQPGAVLWGVGEGWHLFIDQLMAFLDGNLGGLPVYAGQEEDHPAGAQQYRAHVSRELLAFGAAAAEAARSAVLDGRPEDALAKIDQIALAMRQLHRIACQPGVRPDYTIEGATYVVL